MTLRVGRLVVALALGACASMFGVSPVFAQSAALDTIAPPKGLLLKKGDAVHAPHLHNLLHISTTIYTGGEPEREEAFAELAGLGIKTLVSVDGIRPNVEAAQRHELRYVHIPVGYDGIPRDAGQSLAQLVRSAEGPFFIHCHHGNHRGPAAAAIACIAAGETDGRQALRILELAGTSKDYPGLWRDVEHYSPPPSGAVLPALVSVAEVGSLAAAMAKVDRANDLLKLSAAERWAALPDQPDVSPAQNALLVKEAFVEAGRNLSGNYDQPFRDWLKEAAVVAGQLESALRTSDNDAASAHFQRLGQSCKKCHARYRN